VRNVILVPDGNGEFTAGMGMLVDKSDLGFGKRSWRYSMLVKDGVVQKMFIEPRKPGDPFEVSDADTLLAYVNPQAKKPDQVAILTREGCGFCAKAKALLTELGYDYAEVAARAHGAQPCRRRRDRREHRPAGVRQRQRIGGLEALERWARKAA
jgi:glutaredoxin